MSPEMRHRARWMFSYAGWVTFAMIVTLILVRLGEMRR